MTSVLTWRRVAPAVVAALATLSVGGCEFTGVNSVPLPGTKGGDGYRVTVVMDNAVNLVPNSEVKVGEVTVGSVRKIEFTSWKARLTLGIEKDVELPSDVRATIAQKSLLGAEYLELAPPTSDPSPTPLADGDVIGTDRSGRYPETEEVLSSLSLVLNGGGLGQVKTITTELNKALGGRAADVRSLVRQLDTFVGTLDAQKADIVRATEGLDRMAKVYGAQSRTVDTALRDLPRGVDSLAHERKELTRTLAAVSDFGDAAHRIVDASQDDLVANVDNLTPVLRELADAGKDLTYSLGSISFPFPLDSVERGFRGDYINFFATIDVSAETLERDFLAGTPLDGIYSGLLGLVPTGTVTGDGDPLLDPGGLLGKPEGTPGLEAPSLEDLQDVPLVGSLLGGGDADSSGPSSDEGGLLSLLSRLGKGA